MEHEELEKRREVAMRTIRVQAFKKLDEMITRFEEDFEDSVIEALVDAGIDAPIDPDSNPQAIDESLGMVQRCMDDAVKYWHGRCHGPVWVLVSWDPENTRSHGLEVEVFGDRPKTYDGDPNNWPDWFRVFEGNINGGDTVRGDAKGVSFG